jgi:hypothetical protein
LEITKVLSNRAQRRPSIVRDGYCQEVISDFAVNVSRGEDGIYFTKENQGGSPMSRRNLFTIAVIAAVLAGIPAISSVTAFAAPRPKSANAKSTFKTTVELPNDVTLGGKTVSKGTYTLQADESKTTLIAHGKVVAEASSQWKDDKGKAFADNVLTDSGAIKEIRFGGKTRYLSIQN